MVEASFIRVREKFTETAGKGVYMLGLKGLEVGDGDHPPVFVRV